MSAFANALCGSGLTQKELADKIGVSDKTVSKWETGKGLPDITLLEPLAGALGVSVSELLAGEFRVNTNRAGNMLRSKFYVCPVCGNVIHTLGEAAISCHGVLLAPQQAEPADDAHPIAIEPVEDEYFVTVSHPMTKGHHISFIAALSPDRLQLVKLYPEGEAQTRLQLRGRGFTAGFLFHSLENVQTKAFCKVTKTVMEGNQIPIFQILQGCFSVCLQIIQPSY